jgi:hypothetical protein
VSGDTHASGFGEAAREAGAAYSEQGDRVLIANPFLQMALSREDGTLISLVQGERDTELIDAEEAQAEGPLWRLAVRNRRGQADDATSKDCARFTYSFGRHRHEGWLRLWLQWRGIIETADVDDSSLTVQISFPDDAPMVLFDHEIQLPAGYSPAGLDLPCLCAVGCRDPLMDDGVFLPLSGGIYLPNPRARGGDPRLWEVEYPGPASMQLLGYCCGERTALWVAPRDSAGIRKLLTVSGMPSSGRLRLAVTQFPALRPDGEWSSGYPVAVGIADGDWFEAALDYRAWAARQPWTSRGRGGERRTPPLTSAYGLWASYWGGARRVAGTARELQRLVNVPVKLDWRCWHACAREGAYPDYLPPRDGDEAFTTAERELSESGVLDQLSLSALFVSRESALWREEGAETHAVQPGQDTHADGHRPAASALETMCPGTRYWRDKLAAIVGGLVKRGADGVLLEDLDTSPLACEEPSHEHGPAARGQWAESIRSLLAAVRAAVGRGGQIAADGLTEYHLDLVDAVFTRHASAERQGIVPNGLGHRWIPIPLYAAVYHDYTTMAGPGVSLVSHRPHDPMWPAAMISEMRAPPRVMGRDYEAQFCLEVARSLVWGYQPILEGFAPEQSRDEANRRKLAFLAAALRAQAWGIGALLPQSQFLGPLNIECPTLEEDLLSDPPGASPTDRRTRRQLLPSVHGSAWRVPGGGLSAVLVNIGATEVDFTARLRSSRLALQLPLRLMGRTFSEDGDVPAASLRASGSEIGGRLPSRSIVLVSIR